MGQATPPGHGTSAYRKRGCRCDICVAAYREKCRRKYRSRRERGVLEPSKQYVPVSTSCRTCGGMVKRYHGHRYDQCWKCRCADSAEASELKKAERLARRPKCGDCGRPMSGGAKTTRCFECRSYKVSTPCAECGETVRTTKNTSDPKCRACKKPHGIFGWRRGCRCDICRGASINTESDLLNARSRKTKIGRRIGQKQAITAARATRSGPYSPHEDAILLRKDMTTVRCAIILNRTFHSVEMRRKRLGNPGAY